jgi:hypothetical protein
MERAAGWLIVSVHVTELQLSLTVKVYVPARSPVMVGVLPIRMLDEFLQA